jgi:hypothetical protein
MDLSTISWDVVVTATVTGAVGIAGIAGTLWQEKKARESQSRDLKLSIDSAAENLRMSLKAEDARAKIAEKRRIYARCAAAIDDLANMSGSIGVLIELRHF